MRKVGKKSIHRQRILAYSTVGTPDYIAPEVLSQKVNACAYFYAFCFITLLLLFLMLLTFLNLNFARILWSYETNACIDCFWIQGYGMDCDWWSLGVIMYEVRFTPLSAICRFHCIVALI